MHQDERAASQCREWIWLETLACSRRRGKRGSAYLTVRSDKPNESGARLQRCI